MEVNNKGNDFVLTEAEQNFNIVINNADFVIDKNNSKNIASSLAEKSVAELAGTFEPKTAGTKILTAVFHYEEGSTEPVRTETEVIAVKLTIKLVEPVSLPKNLPKNCVQEVEFLVENETEFEATKLNLEVDGIVDVKIIEEKPNNGVYESVTEISMDNFNGVKLDSKHQFRIKGKLATDQEGLKTLKILVKYHELEYLDQVDQDKLGAKFEQVVDIQTIRIARNVKTKLPPKIKLGSVHQVVFQFTNQNEIFAATGVNITITDENTVVFS